MSISSSEESFGFKRLQGRTSIDPVVAKRFEALKDKADVISRLGESRILRILDRYGLRPCNFSAFPSTPAPGWAECIDALEEEFEDYQSKIRVGAAIVTQEDLVEALALLQQNPQDPRFGDRDEEPDQGIEEFCMSVRDKQYDELTHKEMNQLIKLMTPFEVDVISKEERMTMSGGPRSLADKLIHSQVSKDFERYSFHAALLTARNDDEYHETMAKAIVYREVQPHDVLPGPPSSRDQGSGYIFALSSIVSGKGLIVTNFLPIGKGNPLMVVQGTQIMPSAIDSSGTLLADMAGEIGRSAYESGKGSISLALDTMIAATGQRVQLNGHSLGGAIAQIITSERPDCIDTLRIWNSPRVQESTIEAFIGHTEVANHMPNIRIYLSGREGYLNENDQTGDAVQNMGHCYLGYGLSEQSDTLYVEKRIVPRGSSKHTYRASAAEDYDEGRSFRKVVGDERNRILARPTRGSKLEKFRSLLCNALGRCLVRVMRTVYRILVSSSRATEGAARVKVTEEAYQHTIVWLQLLADDQKG